MGWDDSLQGCLCPLNPSAPKEVVITRQSGARSSDECCGINPAVQHPQHLLLCSNLPSHQKPKHNTNYPSWIPFFPLYTINQVSTIPKFRFETYMPSWGSYQVIIVINFEYPSAIISSYRSSAWPAVDHQPSTPPPVKSQLFVPSALVASSPAHFFSSQLTRDFLLRSSNSLNLINVSLSPSPPP